MSRGRAHRAPAGLQPERTGLAWQRTALAAGAVALLLLHGAARSGWGTLALPAGVAGGTALTLAIMGGLRERRLRREPDPRPAPTAMIMTVTAIIAATALTTLATFLR